MENSNDDGISRLRRTISERQAIVVLGAGVAISTNHRAPNWNKTVELALLTALRNAKESRIRRRVRRHLDALSAKKHDIVHIAEMAGADLGSRNGQAWLEFAQLTFGSLRPVDRSLLDAIQGMKLRIATTNYDTLIEQTLGFRSIVTNSELLDFSRRPDYQSVIHLHGIFDQPETIVWGKADYENLLSDYLRGYLQSRISDSGIIFIGCGGTLDDPNFSQWREFLKEIAKHNVPVFRLCSSSESGTLRANIQTIIYGNDYTELPDFLRSVTPWENFLSLPQKEKLRDIEREYAKRMGSLRRQLLWLIKESNPKSRIGYENARLRNFVRTYNRDLNFFFVRNFLGVDIDTSFRCPTFDEFHEIHAQFCKEFSDVDLSGFLLALADAFFEEFLVPVIPEDLGEELFEHMVFDKFLRDAEIEDYDDIELSSEEISRRERAHNLFTASFYSADESDFQLAERRLIEEGRIETNYDPYYDEYSATNEEDVLDEMKGEYEGSVSCDEVEFDGIADTVLNPPIGDIIHVWKDKLEKWKYYKIDDQVVGRDDIIIPSHEFERMSVINCDGIFDAFSEICDKLGIDFEQWSDQPR